MQKLLLFDFDGVIVNTPDMILGVKKDLGTEISAEEYKKFYYGNVLESVEKAQKRSYTKNDQDTFFNLYEPRLQKLDPIPGMISTLIELSRSYTLAIISSTTNKPIENYLNLHNISDCFAFVLGADTHRSKVQKIMMSLDKLSVAPKDSVYITDTLGDIIEARKAGVEAIAVTWGFHDRDTLAKGEPKCIVNDAAELTERIDKLLKQ